MTWLFEALHDTLRDRVRVQLTIHGETPFYSFLFAKRTLTRHTLFCASVCVCVVSDKTTRSEFGSS